MRYELLPTMLCTAFLLMGTSLPPIESIASDECMTCHDGSSAPAVRAENSHRVGIDYALASASGSHFLKPINSPSGYGSSIASDMLVGGRVKCTTCHVSHGQVSEERFRLRNTGVFAGLCLACHAPR